MQPVSAGSIASWFYGLTARMRFSVLRISDPLLVYHSDYKIKYFLKNNQIPENMILAAPSFIYSLL